MVDDNKKRIEVFSKEQKDFNININAPARGDPIPASQRVEAAPGVRGSVDARTRNIELAKANANAMRNEAAQSNALANSMLQVNMSMLGVTFGIQNMTNALMAFKTQELQELQMKEKKTKADKERIKELKREQAEMKKWTTIMTGVVSVLQFAMTMGQLYLAVKQKTVIANAMDANTAALAASAKSKEGKAAYFSASGNVANQAAKGGVFAPAIVAIIIGAIVGGIALLMGIKAATAAKGADVFPSLGGSLFRVGEAGQREVISPVPMLEKITREQTMESIRESGGGGVTMVVNAIDAESFIEKRGDVELMLNRSGVERNGR